MENIGERSFILSDGTTYHIVNPNTDDIKNADWAYSKVYTKSLMEGIATASEMVDILTKRGLIGPEYEQRAQELSENLREAIDSLRLSKNNVEKKARANVVALAREELFRWNQRFSNPMSHTCEQLADDSRLEHLAFSMIRDSNSKRVWSNYNAYIEDKNQELTQKSRLEVMLYLQGVSSDFMSKTPEAVAIREIADEVLSDMDEAQELNDVLDEEVIEEAIDAIAVAEAAVTNTPKLSKPATAKILKASKKTGKK